MIFVEDKLKNLLAEGKTKQIWEISKDEVLVVSKDRITAWNGVRKHDLEDKSIISNQTTSNIFIFLKEAGKYLNYIYIITTFMLGAHQKLFLFLFTGIKTAFIEKYEANSFRSERCEMIPIEWVARRLATGSFLKGNPGVEEEYMFTPPLLETFFKVIFLNLF